MSGKGAGGRSPSHSLFLNIQVGIKVSSPVPEPLGNTPGLSAFWETAPRSSLAPLPSLRVSEPLPTLMLLFCAPPLLRFPQLLLSGNTALTGSFSLTQR